VKVQSREAATVSEAEPLVDFALFDADSHCYDPRDAFTRYIEPKFRDVALRPVRDSEGHEFPVVGDRIVTFVDSNVYEMVHVPGTLAAKLRATKVGDTADERFYQEIQPEHMEREVRLTDLDNQNVQAAMIFPSLGLMAESFIRRSDELYANLNAFNRWLAEDWGFAYKNRLFAPPMISLRDRDEAVKQLDWVIEQGAKVVMFRTGPAYGRSPGDPYFDAIWGRLNDARVNVAYHITESGYNAMYSHHWGQDTNPPPYNQSAWQWMNLYGDRAIMDTLSALIYDNVFGRFPNLKVGAIEHGAEWLPYFLGRLDKMRGLGRQGPWIGGPLTARPTEIFGAHCLVVPYEQDDVRMIVERVGSRCLFMGSDYPHGEGMANPGVGMPKMVDFLPKDELRAVCRDRGLAFVGQPT
jgi:predicted TIM-barrel fold metal-dependent hydrolase